MADRVIRWTTAAVVVGVAATGAADGGRTDLRRFDGASRLSTVKNAGDRAGAYDGLGLRRGPLHYAEHQGDFIVVLDADLGVGVTWGSEGAQECDVLLQFGQGRAVGKGPLDLTRILSSGRIAITSTALNVSTSETRITWARRRAIMAAPCTARRRIGRAEGPDRRPNARVGGNVTGHLSLGRLQCALSPRACIRRSGVGPVLGNL